MVWQRLAAPSCCSARERRVQGDKHACSGVGVLPPRALATRVPGGAIGMLRWRRSGRARGGSTFRRLQCSPE